MYQYNDYIHTCANMIKQYMDTNKYDDVIQLCIPLYCNTKEVTFLNYILESYRKTNSVNAISNFKMLLEHTDPMSTPYCMLHNEIGMYYSYNEEYIESIKHFNKILDVRNDIPDVYYNIGVCYKNIKEYNNALEYLDRMLQLRPTDNIYILIGDISFYLKQYDKSIQSYESVINKTNTNLYNLSFPYLAKKNFLKGFTLYENRLLFNDICRQTGLITRVEVPIPYWDGVEYCNHLMIIYEQGIGDNIQYFRFIIELSQKYPDLKVTYFCKSNVSHLFNVDLYPNINIIDDSKPVMLTIYDKKIYIMSLPYILKIDTLTRNTINYINEDKNNHDMWKNKLSVFNNKLKVGIVYNGLLNSFIEKNIELKHFRDICMDKNIQCINLHMMNDKMLSEFTEIDFNDNIINYNIDASIPFIDTISILRNLDVLVTIDTSITHIAGVMGVKTLLLLGYMSDWRWFNDNENMWYDSVEIIRMTENKPLSQVLPHVKNRLVEEYTSKHEDTAEFTGHT